MSQLIIENKPIGKGSFGEVFRGTYHGTSVAIKVIKERKRMTKKMIECFENEAKIMQTLRHPNIVLFMGITDNHGIVSEYCDNGDLYKIIHLNKKVHSVGEVMKIMKGVASGLSYLHAKKIIHGDVKSQNILMDVNNVPKVADFGYSKTKNSTLSMTQHIAGSPIYMAPEVLREEPYNIKADVYSFAILMWEMMSNDLPFSDFSYHQLFRRVGMNGERPIIPSTTPIDVVQLITACWDQDATKRMTMTETVNTLSQLMIKYPMVGGAMKAEKEEEEDKQACDVCMEEKKCMVFIPCGHVCCCENCSQDVKDCPICRQKIAQKFKVFVS
eukprot:TRINITY_DN2829_c0_g1_i1.p1 TRINITY_DN2829_c0_g1~~TRINITY_DN2829_c0_g1_i1.p1  ORF type:complete len:328 (+),score=82.14 TRINITY_DN2829_c0_g1_i1:74-1057(+)